MMSTYVKKVAMIDGGKEVNLGELGTLLLLVAFLLTYLQIFQSLK